MCIYVTQRTKKYKELTVADHHTSPSLASLMFFIYWPVAAKYMYTI